MSRNICLLQKIAAFLTAAFAVDTSVFCFVLLFFCLLGTDQSLPLCSRFLSRKQEFNSASANLRTKKTSLFPESNSSKHPPRSLRCSIALIFHLGYTFNVVSDGNLLDGDRLQESLAPPSPHRSIIEQPPRRTQRALSLSFVPTKLEPWS